MWSRLRFDLGFFSLPQLPALQLHLIACACWHFRQGQNQIEIVIGGDAVEALEVAAQAAVHQDILAVWSLEIANRGHSAAASARTISFAHIDMARVEAEGAVVAMMPTRRQGADETTAIAALENLFG